MIGDGLKCDWECSERFRRFYWSIGHVRYINILAWIRGFRVKIANFASFFCLSIPKRDLDTKKTTPNIEVWPESLGAMLEYWYIERGLLILWKVVLLPVSNCILLAYWAVNFRMLVVTIQSDWKSFSLLNRSDSYEDIYITFIYINSRFSPVMWSKLKNGTIQWIKARIWDTTDDWYINNLAKNQVSTVFHSRVICRRLSYIVHLCCSRLFIDTEFKSTEFQFPMWQRKNVFVYSVI